MPEDASTLILGTFGIAVVAVLLFWRWTFHVVSLTQQAGIAALSLLTGARFGEGFFWARTRKIEAWAWFRGRSGWWPSQFVTLTVGTLTPSIAGLILARGVDVGWNARTVLLVLLVLLGATVLIHGDWFILLLIAFLAGLVAVFVYFGGPAAQLGAVVTLAWILLLGGLRLAAEDAGWKHGKQFTSPGVLQDMTDIPAAVWVLAFLFLALSAAVAGTRWLIS